MTSSGIAIKRRKHLNQDSQQTDGMQAWLESFILWRRKWISANVFAAVSSLAMFACSSYLM